MEKIKRNGWMVAFLAVVALMCSQVIFGDAANWDPPGPPAPTMTSLDAIYNAIGASCSVAEREGYCQHFNVPHATTLPIFTVAPGKRFVLLKFWANSGSESWELRVDGADLIHGSIGGTTTSKIWDVPDRCVVVNADSELTFHNDTGNSVHTGIIGYFYEVP